MSDPASSSAAAGVAGWKAIGGAAGAAAAGAGLAAVVVMCMTPPRSLREWVVGIICTVLGSVAGGAFVILHFNLHAWADSYLGLVSMLGLVFACGLPAWTVVRWVFNFLERRRQSDIADIADELHRRLRGRDKPPL